MATGNRQVKMIDLILHRMRVTLQDGRQMVGQMLAFDKHMNLVLADTEEFRRVKRKPTKGQAPGSTQTLVEAEEKRTLGLIILRGKHIVSTSVEGPPPADPAARLGAGATSAAGTAPPTMAAGPGISRPAGRGNLPVGLTGPAAGVGGPAPGGFGGGFQGGFPPGSGPPPGFAGRGGPPGGPPGYAPSLPSFPGQPQAGFQPPPGFQPSQGQGRGYPPQGYGGSR